MCKVIYTYIYIYKNIHTYKYIYIYRFTSTVRTWQHRSAQWIGFFSIFFFNFKLLKHFKQVEWHAITSQRQLEMHPRLKTFQTGRMTCSHITTTIWKASAAHYCSSDDMWRGSIREQWCSGPAMPSSHSRSTRCAATAGRGCHDGHPRATRVR